MLFFKKGQPVIPPLRPDQGLDMVLEHMVMYFLSIPLNRKLTYKLLPIIALKFYLRPDRLTIS